jgi:dolichol-phosphate mannosyltransferase
LLFALLGALQTILAARVIHRMLKTARGEHIETSDRPSSERISIIVTVLNEAKRIESCLNQLIAQPREVAEILIIDGGSTDATHSIVESYLSRDPRMKWIDASPVDPQWTGKAWGLHVGLARCAPSNPWILCIDADVRISAQLARSLLAHATRTGVATFSVATGQHLSSHAEALLHPSFLTTLVYRFGQPGSVSRNRHQVQANGQCFLSRRKTLLRTQAFAAAQNSLCEDITIVRRLTECGESVGFYETHGLAQVRMYSDWRETWKNWPRSLPMRDQYFGWQEIVGLLEVLFVQGLPLPMLIVGWGLSAARGFFAINAVLLALRIGVLVGTARAYHQRTWTYWLSPLCDLPVALRLLHSAFTRRHQWRGRSYVRHVSGAFKPEDVIQ